MANKVKVPHPNGDQICVSPEVGVQGYTHRSWSTEHEDGLEGKRAVVDIVLGQEVRYRLLHFGIRKPFGNIFCLTIQGEKVVKLPEGPYLGFPHMEGMMIEFSREGCQV